MTLGVWLSGEHVSAGLVVGLDDLRVLLKLERFNDLVFTHDI